MLLAVLTGTVAGVGAFTFHYGEGLSYFSTDPRACKNCHVMNDAVRVVDAWAAPRGGALRRLPPAARARSEVPRQGRQRLPAFEGLHVHGLPRADHDQAAQRANPAGELPALPRRLRARHRRGAARRGRMRCSASTAIAASATARDPELRRDMSDSQIRSAPATPVARCRRRRRRVAVARVPARRAAHVHLPAQAGSEEPVRPARRGQRRHDRSRRRGA